MSTITVKGNPVTTNAVLPAVGSVAPDFTLAGTDLQDITLDSLRGHRLVLNIFASLDTGVCAASVRKFNELAAGLEDTTVVCISHDLPFAQARFCGAEGIDNVVMGSGFRSEFARDYGVLMIDGPMEGLCARSVIVIAPNSEVTYTQLVPEISQEPDYDQVLAALREE